MIISHKHRYLFIELPRTASTAISKELRELYDGVPILRKHATYEDFLQVASPDEKTYFVFSCIRNPLDHAVSLYFKYKSDHKHKFSDPVKISKRKGLVNQIAMFKFRFVRKTEAEFSTYFRKFYKIPYNDWSALSHKQFDFVIHFEQLQQDFATALELIGLEQKRPLPTINRTSGKDRNFAAYYTPDIIPRAKRIFGPYMKEWGYTFPPEWGETSVPWWNQLEFNFFNIFRQLYWRYLRSRI